MLVLWITFAANQYFVAELYYPCFGIWFDIFFFSQKRHLSYKIPLWIWPNIWKSWIVKQINRTESSGWFQNECYCSGPSGEVTAMTSRVQQCASDVSNWCSAKRLQLNTDKTELFFGLVQHRSFVRCHKTAWPLHGTRMSSSCLQRSTTCVLCSTVDSELSVCQHVFCVSQTCFFSPALSSVYAEIAIN